MSLASPAPGTASRVREVTAAISRAATAGGVDFSYLLGQARIESGLNPDAKAPTSSAIGLFQFTRQTWLATVKRHGHANGYGWAADAIEAKGTGAFKVGDPALRLAIDGLRTDPNAASTMAAAFATDNAELLRAEFGREPESVDLYLAHFLGASGAKRFLAAHDATPDMPAAPLFPAAAAANRSIFYGPGNAPRTLADIRSRFAQRLEREGTPPPGIPEQPGAAAPMVRSAIATAQQPVLMRQFEPMPKRLSLAFAQQAYQRLAALPGSRG